MRPEGLAVDALREWLLATLPAKVAELNVARKATLKSALLEPFTITSGMELKLSAVGPSPAGTTVSLTTGSRTAAQVAADITTAAPAGLVASAVDGRVVVTSTSTPVEGAPSVVCVQPDDTGANAVFGWEAGGERVDVAALVAPSWRGVVDGEWLAGPDMGKGFWVALRGRTSKPAPQAPSIRRGEFLVTMAVEVIRPFGSNATPHRSREAITACVQAVRECLTDTSAGRQLGRAAYGDVQLTDVSSVSIPAEYFGARGALFDVAGLTVTLRIFQPPSGP